MRRFVAISASVFLVALLFLDCARLRAGQVDGKKNVPLADPPPQPMPKEIVETWWRAGFGFAWMGLSDDGKLTRRSAAEAITAGDLPWFYVEERYRDGVLAMLPVPEQRSDCASVVARPTGDLTGVARLKNLQALMMDYTSATDAGLKGISGLKCLRYLNIRMTKVTDAGLKELAPLTNLRTLGLSGTNVTDAGLKDLARMPGLRSLQFGGDPITTAGLRELKKALPGCRIHYQ